ncbi:hypothetical protein [Neptunicella marina]|uniref:Uncharacterized protein n=1 Tax=Neptunicella marina TaxID=2125989 RepID=A0A8J6ISL4_9ALTE|nr:hypothetical protein [Neptunicella marina]MBC3765015.1 hypothetical protein [Neptunicella marina]
MINYKAYCVEQLQRYWQGCEQEITQLPVRALAQLPDVALPVQLNEISLPPWANECSVDGVILVPAEVCHDGDDWQCIDWWYVCYWYVNCLAERKFEQQSGTIHSYAFKLDGWDKRMWQRAWVNRIAMFLRLWCQHANPHNALSALPDCEIYLTHDLDAVSKTWAIRCKQSLFHAFNAARELKNLHLKASVERLKKSLRFLFSKGDYWQFDALCDLNSAQITRVIHLYGGAVGFTRNLQQMLIDPAYDISERALMEELLKLRDAGFKLGMHPSFDAWNNLINLRNQKAKLEVILGQAIKYSRQHWLKFSFKNTWKNLADTGISTDSTLGFNDQSGFRNGAALVFVPVDPDNQQSLQLKSLPLVLMDSQLFDYAMADASERRVQIDYFIDEIIHTKGQASLLWHPHTLSEDYGWSDDYQYLCHQLINKLS